MMSMGLLATCREVKLKRKTNCGSSWLLTRIIPRRTVNRT